MRKRMRWLIFGVGFLAALGPAGCGPKVRGTAADFTRCGLPERQFLVGGGFQICYSAPGDGTIFWADEETQRILVMQTVRKGQQIRYGPPDRRYVQDILGVYMDEVKLNLYFVPAGVPCWTAPYPPR